MTLRTTRFPHPVPTQSERFVVAPTASRRPALRVAMAVLASFMAASAAVSADGDIASRLRRCAAIEHDAQRLVCFDEVAREASPRRRHPDRVEQTQRIDDVHRNEPGRLAGTSADSMLDRRWELDPESKLGVFNLRAHRPIYILPVFWNPDPNRQPTSDNPANVVDEAQRLKEVENKFQLSFKTKVVEGVIGDLGDLWFGYTQSSRWQLYDEDTSRPFRETNYEPEIDLVFGFDEPLFGDWRARMLALGAVHQSNGRDLPLSRSWDRLKATFAAERDGWVVMLRPWWRIGESALKDDNPNAEDFLGRADLHVVHQWNDHEFSMLLRHSLRSGERSRGAVQLDWSFPLQRYLRAHLQVFDGYGESMIDYNHRSTYLGVGVSLLPWY